MSTPKMRSGKEASFRIKESFASCCEKKDAIDEHVILEIGGLSDITQFCKSADLNGLLEINVG
jgi:hypothetical protein